MSTRTKFTEVVAIVCTVLLMAACGGEDTTSRVPVANDPSKGPTVEIDPTQPVVDNRLPDISRSASIFLTDNIAYRGLIDIFEYVAPPVIGMPFLILNLPNSTNEAIASGEISLGFEDNEALVYAKLPAVASAGTRSSTYLNALYSDPGLTLRITGDIASQTVTQGNVYYRVRASGETACLRIQCRDAFQNVVACNADQLQTAAQTCRTYMAEDNSSVKLLGTYNNFDLRKWVR